MNKVSILTNRFNEEVIKYKMEKILDCEVFTYYDVDNYNENILKYKSIKKINPNINIFKYLKYMIQIYISILLLDKIQMLIRSKICFEINKGSFERIEKSIKNNMYKQDSLIKIFKMYFMYKNRINNIFLDKPKNCMKIGIISNNYIPNKYYFDYTLENILSKKNMISYRFIDSYNIKSKIKNKYYMHSINKYCKFNIGDNIIRNIYITKKCIQKDFDGILFIKSTSNIKDESTNIILKNICLSEDIPFITLTYSENINENKIDNVVNALYDMIKINRK